MREGEGGRGREREKKGGREGERKREILRKPREGPHASSERSLTCGATETRNEVQQSRDARNKMQQSRVVEQTRNRDARKGKHEVPRGRI